jgi:hypothetical protein
MKTGKQVFFPLSSNSFQEQISLVKAADCTALLAGEGSLEE